MLIEFRVANHLSFLQPMSLALVASRDASLPANTLDPGGDLPRLLRAAAVYGANASGKTNLVRSLGLVRQLVLASATEGRPDSPIAVSPFRLDPVAQASPSTFEITFVIDGERWQYGFEAVAAAIREEWLHHFPGQRRRTLFTRSAARSPEYRWGESWTGDRAVLAQRTRPNALFLSVAAQFNHEIASRLFRWFDRQLNVHLPGSPPLLFEAETRDLCQARPDMRENVVALLRHADVGITGIQVVMRPLGDYYVFQMMPPGMRQQLPCIDNGEAQYPVFRTLRTGHDAEGRDIQVEFSLEEESAGTRRFFALAAPLLKALEDGACLVADELDGRLHPLLTRRIVELFDDPRTNPKGAQLVFTTHDVNLLDQRSLLRRDQVWFTSRAGGGGTELYSLWDFKAPRKEANLRKDYLLGRYGAVPFIERLLEG
ncbi:MAG: ATP-binding protein [Deltaproteobacteria bacterium]|nr:ATP-binding protein [Deltaproteobacteria bacterium]